MLVDNALVYEDYVPEQEGLREALCTLGNGLFATRGAAPEAEADDVHYPGTYVAGCYNRLRTEIAGRAVENEDLVNVPNWLRLTFRIDGGAWFRIDDVTLHAFRQELDLRNGLLVRQADFTDAAGRRTRLVQRRMVHMEDPHLAALETTITAVDWSGPVEVHAALDGRVANGGVARYRHLANVHLVPVRAWEVDGETVALEVETSQSGVRVAEASRTRLIREPGTGPLERRAVVRDGYVAHDLTFHLDEGHSATVEKLVALTTSRDFASADPASEAVKRAQRAGTFDELLERQVLTWSQLWDRCALEAQAQDPDTGRVLNLHIFHLLQTVSLNTIHRDVGVPARGLHGEAYRGHVFWDELFIFPFLTLHLPIITRSLLLYRYRRLPEARWAAASEGRAGAMFPWQSGSDGREESQTLHLNPRSARWVPDRSRLQRHIGSAIAYNTWRYVQVTGDRDFLSWYGAEMIIEIARFWASAATYNRAIDRYEILGVMGPDEYHDAYPDRAEPGLDNNAYTNVMAVWVLRRALEVLDLVPAHRRDELREMLGLRREETERWHDLTRKMVVPFHGDGIISQFEGYEELEELDWLGYVERYGDIQRLDRILEAEGDSPNRYKASKQADVLMLFYLLPADEVRALLADLGYEFDDGAMARTIDYYLARTSHGSTLSRVVHSWVLARSERERSWRMFLEAAQSDLADIQAGTTKEGIHLGAMAGTVDLVQRCWTGLEIRDGVLWFSPSLPPDVQAMRFRARWQDQWLEVEVGPEVLKVVAHQDGPPVRLGLGGCVVDVDPGASVETPL